ncbi:Ubiquitin carboxyl-terminal hydrolase 16 [Gossypium arboreum]|uniref:Ubiquitin carboxyl-terminal hydrolase 16 n=1 Tax=Gossypium arboreum TaxID=29729 RepID=A0A0B0P749_GOSAR|nr:Ubiquitin carboxyl-terminal hydrolase 16 [Gossypium arboreum]
MLTLFRSIFSHCLQESTDIWKRVQHLCFLLVSFGRSSVAAQLKDFRVCKCFRYHVACKQKFYD